MVGYARAGRLTLGQWINIQLYADDMCILLKMAVKIAVLGGSGKSVASSHYVINFQ